MVVDGQRGEDVRRLGQAAGRVEAGDGRLHAEHDRAADLGLALGLRLVELAPPGAPRALRQPVVLSVATAFVVAVVVAAAGGGDQRETTSRANRNAIGTAPGGSTRWIPPMVVCSERWSGRARCDVRHSGAGNVGPWWQRVNNPPGRRRPGPAGSLAPCPAERSRRRPVTARARGPTAADPAGELRAEGRFAEAAELLDAEHRALRRSRTDRAELALAKLARGVVAHDLGDLAGAAALLADGPRRTLVAGQRPEAVAVCAFDLALVHHDLGELDDAVDRLHEARAIFESHRPPRRGGGLQPEPRRGAPRDGPRRRGPGPARGRPGRVRGRGSHRRRGRVRPRPRHHGRLVRVGATGGGMALSPG